jgi:hypothetical protein
MSDFISSGQLKRLQTLYGQLSAHTFEPATREARIAWASKLIERPIASFKDLTAAEAKRLIDTIQGQLGIPETQLPKRRRAKRLDRDAAQKAGTEGRKGFESNQDTMAGDAEWARIRYALDKLGWSRQQLDGWLRSPHSPLSKSNPRIVTLGDANRVWWALKRMIDRNKAAGARAK